MCTVTFVPTQHGIFFSSSRDERTNRKEALPPTIQNNLYGNFLSPIDKEAGGTWITLHENGYAMVLLNGAFQAHTPNPPYKKSRGLIMLDLMTSHDPVLAFAEIDLQGIEPFTIIIYKRNVLLDCRWDGTEKHQQLLDARLPHIWSSCTLYAPAVQASRQEWFNAFLQVSPEPGMDQIIRFHSTAGNGDPMNDVLMNRSGLLRTVSITCIQLQKGTGFMKYLDTRKGPESAIVLSLEQTTD